MGGQPALVIEDEYALEMGEKSAYRDQERVFFRVMGKVIGDKHGFVHVAFAHGFGQFVVVEILAYPDILFDVVGCDSFCALREVCKQFGKFVGYFGNIHSEIVDKHLKCFGVDGASFRFDEFAEPWTDLLVSWPHGFENDTFGGDMFV